MTTVLGVLWWIVVGFIAFMMVGIVWMVWIDRWLTYRRAKREITPWVQSYKARCRGNNRFVVTVPDLQDAFREYDTDTLKKVWNHLVNEKIIQQDPMDNEWCIR